MTVKPVRCALLLAFGFVSAGCNPTPAEADLCKGRQTGDLVITEFLNDPSGIDTGNEWIEVFNTLGTPLDLKGITVYTKKADGSSLKTHLIRAGTVSSRGYFTVGDVRMGALPGHIGYAYADSLGALANVDGIIGFKCKDTVLDEVKYTITPKAGHARQLNGTTPPDAAANDLETNWCDAPNAFMGTDFGSPGGANPDCVVTPGGGSCLDNGAARPIVYPSPGDLVITEVMANPKAIADTEGEWFEVKANAPVDLNGLVITSGSSKNTLSSGECVRVTAGEHAVLGKSTDAGIPSVRVTFTLALINSGGALSLGFPDAGVIDTATIPAALDGISWQLDPAKTGVTENDDPANFCRATARFGDPDAGDFGTPGLGNTTCPVIPTGDECMDPGGAMRAIVRPNVGDLVISEVMADPTKVNDTDGEWFEVVVNNTVDLNGLVVVAGTTSTTLAAQTCLSHDAGSHVVFAHSADPAVNGYLPPVLGTFVGAIAQAGGTLSLKGSDAGVLDTITYGASVAGASSQLDGTKYDALLNDNLANFCITDAGVTYGPLADGGPGDRGTPAAQNKACP